MRKSKIIAYVIIVYAVFSLFPRGRDLLERAYVGVPVSFALNYIRPYFNSENGAACLDQLTKSGFPFLPEKETRGSGACWTHNPVSLYQPLAARRVMSCALAKALAEYLQRSVQPLARSMFNQNIYRVEDLGVISCRTMTGKRVSLSEHAYGNAIDLSAFILSNGKRISVKEHWGSTEIEGLFLKRLALQACAVFNTVLSPDADTFHADHLHLDMGRSVACKVMPVTAEGAAGQNTFSSMGAGR